MSSNMMLMEIKAHRVAPDYLKDYYTLHITHKDVESSHLKYPQGGYLGFQVTEMIKGLFWV